MSQELLAALTASVEPFYCLMCSRETFKQQVNQLVMEVECLKSELKVIPTLQTTIENLKGEIADLRRLYSSATDCRGQPTQATYANAVSRPLHPTSLPALKSRTPRNAKAHPGRKPDNEATAAGSLASDSSKGNSGKEMVSGIRRIWKTMRSATASTISATLKKLTTIGSKLSIRRRSRPGSAAGKSTYWFIIRSNEEVLQQLDEWDQVEMQIG